MAFAVGWTLCAGLSSKVTVYLYKLIPERLMGGDWFPLRDPEGGGVGGER